MTRREIKTWIYKNADIGNPSSVAINADDAMVKMLEILDHFEQKKADCDVGESWQEGYNQAKRDFEKRTCETCKQNDKDDKGFCLLHDCKCIYLGNTCGKWEQKEIK